jgi:hypothetical protein
MMITLGENLHMQNGKVNWLFACKSKMGKWNWAVCITLTFNEQTFPLTLPS